ncbi:hypothetical protein R1flu_009974 [Riccia fluitans]|uniref:GDSL esterase/lipase n=1 Tax=Riccia fluitans TaxID=41844 RepID=A0ABD1Z3P1_9MARC
MKIRRPAASILTLILINFHLTSGTRYRIPTVSPLLEGFQSDSDPSSCCIPAIFSFGSSVADTGTNLLLAVDLLASRYPYGVTFPGYASGRWSNGRLLIDFWAELLGLPYVDPFVNSGSSSFRQGANFASAGSTATDRYASFAPSSFSLSLQLHQFSKFKSQTVATHSEQEAVSGDQKIKDCGSKLVPTTLFQKALYIIAAGGNDVHHLTDQDMTIEEKKTVIPEISAAIMQTVEALHEEGARTILVEDVYPLGCLPASIFDVGGVVDSDGCVESVNELIRSHNSILRKELAAFAQKHSTDLSIALVDTYSIRHGLMTNPAKHGFKYGMAACCGIYGMPLRYKSDELCTQSQRTQLCMDPSEYVVWEGIHYTEAANNATMKAILSGVHFYPEFSLSCFRSCSSQSAVLAK